MDEIFLGKRNTPQGNERNMEVANGNSLNFSEEQPRGTKEDAGRTTKIKTEFDYDKENEVKPSVGSSNSKKRRKGSTQKRRKKRPCGKTRKNSCLPRAEVRRVRRFRRARPSSPIRFEDYYCPMVQWPNTGRVERPEYPSCLEGVEEYKIADSFPVIPSFSETEPESAFEGLEVCIVPGYLEAVLKYCRTSPTLPSGLRPDPDTLRELLLDACVLQCILRGISPVMMATYLSSLSAEKWPSDLSKMSDSDLLAGE